MTSTGMPLTPVVGPGTDGIAGVYVHVKFQNDPDPRKLHVFVGSTRDAVLNSMDLRKKMEQLGPITFIDFEVVTQLFEDNGDQPLQFFKWKFSDGKVFTVCSIAPNETFESLEQGQHFARAVAAHGGEYPTRLDEDPNQV